MPNTPTPEQDFLRLKYTHDRNHELELNRATSAYEQATLRVLLALNGGSATAFLTLYAALSEGSGTPDKVATLAAIGLWGAGLLCAGLAVMTGRKLQAKFSTAYRHRRMSIERAMIQAPDLAPLARLSPETDPHAITREIARLAELADSYRTHAHELLGRAETLARWSLILFVLGLASAAIAVIA